MNRDIAPDDTRHSGGNRSAENRDAGRLDPKGLGPEGLDRTGLDREQERERLPRAHARFRKSATSSLNGRPRRSWTSDVSARSL